MMRLRNGLTWVGGMTTNSLGSIWWALESHHNNCYPSHCLWVWGAGQSLNKVRPTTSLKYLILVHAAPAALNKRTVFYSPRNYTLTATKEQYSIYHWGLKRRRLTLRLVPLAQDKQMLLTYILVLMLPNVQKPLCGWGGVTFSLLC